MIGYDIIGDVHGYDFLLIRLLKNLGYQKGINGFFHPNGRKVIFVGDLINRGPSSIKVLKIVKRMHLNKQAFCVLGNHEFRLLQKSIFNPSLIEKNLLQFIPWIKSLPLFLEFAEFRVVHAAWHYSSIEKLARHTLIDDSFLKSTLRSNSENKKAVKTILQGIKVSIPEEILYLDRFGIRRKKARLRWWEKNKKIITGKNLFPVSDKLLNLEFEMNDEVKCEEYDGNEKPVFCGHYCLPSEESKVNYNVVCLDGCVTCDKVLWGYQHSTQKTINEKNLVIS